MRKLDGYANLDVDRLQRTGIPEIVLAEGKTPQQVRDIAAELAEANGRVLVSRLDDDAATALRDLEPRLDVTHEALGRIAVVSRPDAKRPETAGRVAILAAGTSDLPVVTEARVTARELGCEVRVATDVGVAGIHRLYPELDWVREMDVVIVAAGREGALATVVAGLVDVPIVGLPVSTGYGVGGRGEAALLSMLQSCSPLTVVNVDAGVVAGACAARIANAMAAARDGRVAGPPEDAQEVEPHHG